MLEGGHADFLASSPPMFGPGGGNLFQSSNGDWMAAYHYYDGSRHWHGDVWGKPTMQIRSVIWHEGWPLPGIPLGVQANPCDLSHLKGTWIVQEDFGQPIEVLLMDGGLYRSVSHDGSWIASGSLIRLFTDNGLWATCTLDQRSGYFVGRTGSGKVLRGINKNAQLA